MSKTPTDEKLVGLAVKYAYAVEHKSAFPDEGLGPGGYDLIFAALREAVALARAADRALIERAKNSLDAMRERLEDSLGLTDCADPGECVECIENQIDQDDESALCADHLALERAVATLAALRARARPEGGK